MRTDRNSIVLSIGSKQIAQDLANNFNIIPKKSLVLLPPVRMPNEYAHHFIRGYVDGDGWIGKTAPAIGVAGTKTMLEWIKSVFGYNCSVGNPTVRKRKNSEIFELTFGGIRQTFSIIEWLYKDSDGNTRLKRKWRAAQSYVLTLTG